MSSSATFQNRASREAERRAVSARWWPMLAAQPRRGPWFLQCALHSRPRAVAVLLPCLRGAFCQPSGSHHVSTVLLREASSNRNQDGETLASLRAHPATCQLVRLPQAPLRFPGQLLSRSVISPLFCSILGRTNFRNTKTNRDSFAYAPPDLMGCLLR